MRGWLGARCRRRAINKGGRGPRALLLSFAGARILGQKGCALRIFRCFVVPALMALLLQGGWNFSSLCARVCVYVHGMKGKEKRGGTLYWLLWETIQLEPGRPASLLTDKARSFVFGVL